MKALWVQMIDLYLFFRFVKGRCHGNQLILRKSHERRLIPLALFVLSLENELQYHCLDVCINSGDDVATSCKNLVNFCQVTPEITGLICVPRYLYLAKINHTSAFIMLPFRNAMEHWNADGCINTGNVQATAGINLVGF